MGLIRWSERVMTGIEGIFNPNRSAERRSHSGFSNPFNQIFNLNSFNTSVTAFNGSRLTTVYNCLNILAQDIGSLDFNVFKEIEPGNNQKQGRNNPIQRLINTQPNKWMNAVQFWQYMVFVGESRGNSYAWIQRDSRMDPVALIPFLSDEVTIIVDRTSLEYNFFYSVRGVIFRPDEIFHYRRFTHDGVQGISPILWNSGLIDYKMRQDQYSNQSIGNQPVGFFTSPTTFRPDQQKDIKDEWQRETQGKLGRGTPFMHGDLKFNTLALTPEVTQLVESKNWSDKQTRGIWRIAPTFLQDYENANLNNSAFADLNHVKYTLTPITKVIEQECDQKFFLESNKTTSQPLFTDFNFNTLLRADLKTFSEFASSMINSGTFNADEIRSMLKWAPQADEIGKVYMIQSQNVPKKHQIENPQQKNDPNSNNRNSVDDLLQGIEENGNKQ